MCLVALGAWMLSLYHPLRVREQRRLQDWSPSVTDGCIVVEWSTFPGILDRFPRPVFGAFARGWVPHVWVLGSSDDGREVAVFVPCWNVLAVLLVGTAGVWWIDRRRYFSGRCQHCGYDLTGNVSGRCPECGTRVPASESCPGSPGPNRFEAKPEDEPDH